MPAFPPIYPITDTALSGGRSHAELVSLLCRGGATLVQLREKRLDDRALLAEARSAVEVAASVGCRVIVNDRADIAVLAGAAGVHVGGSDLPVEKVRALVGPGALVGCSTHSVEEAVAAAAGPVDYVAIGPIYETTHAAVARPALGPEAVGRVAARIQVPLVAIGGIDPGRAAILLAAGAASVAVMGDLMTAVDIPSRTAEYLSLGS